MSKSEREAEKIRRNATAILQSEDLLNGVADITNTPVEKVKKVYGWLSLEESDARLVLELRKLSNAGYTSTQITEALVRHRDLID